MKKLIVVTSDRIKFEEYHMSTYAAEKAIEAYKKEMDLFFTWIDDVIDHVEVKSNKNICQVKYTDI